MSAVQADMLKRFSISLLAAIGFVLITEGLLSLLLGRSWEDFFHRRTFLETVADPEIQTDAARFEAATRTPGPYRIHDDPRVGYVLKSNNETELAGATVVSDELGLRARPGPPPAPDAFRLVVLGDSVAFGWGLEGDDVLAVRLEDLLRGARQAGEPEIACRTVAIPSWNYKNAVRFMLDHADVLRPDLVLYMHVPNDLNDCSGVYESGHRRSMPDVCSPDPLVVVSENMPYIKRAVQRLKAAGIALADVDPGPEIMTAAISPTSSTRIEDMARTLDGFQRWLENHGAELVLLPYYQHDLHRQLRVRLAERGVEIPVIPLLEDMTREDTLGFDPHPSAETVEAFAVWTARSLIEEGRVPRASADSLPAVPERYAGRRGRELSVDELERWSADYEESVRSALSSVIEDGSARGVRQVYGGIHIDGSMGPALLALLPPGRVLRVELAPFADAPALYPLEVRVQVDGEDVGSLTLPSADGSGVVRELPLPEKAATTPFEVRLVPDDYELVQVLGKSMLVSARFVSLASLAE